ncbi:TlpA family protein disulfide reductase [Micromonospora avicenniae]|uniref:Thiol-disulfide isomerase or thioredoxin n=1 Tax=Micromonospora avicenniae TaxID=1198245 RepID=A0A1N6R4V9_9ACTN|nr:TlpA disulfide reductase family protein [Micromonospora avicenniae]SIQ23895.1 Thiol-disulfide isomerase or thioredoxin [Micromonospora avicenniae]
MNRRIAVLLLPLLVAAAAGCTATGTEEPAPPRPRAERPSPFEDCARLTTPATPTAGAGTPSAATDANGHTGDPLPELTLACFTGGAPIALRDVRGPAVINVWASWCPPCRKELPAFQRLSKRAGDRIHVIGVNSQDSRSAAQSIGEDLGIGFPMLVDQGTALQRALNRNAFPLTLLVDAQGRVVHTDASGALDDASLGELVREHLGVAVPA